jgi:NADH dehydrogenase FAD-containing subunit
MRIAMNDSVQAPIRIVILGGGFAGVDAAKCLSELLGRRRDVEVELLSEENYFVFQPLLPEVAVNVSPGAGLELISVPHVKGEVEVSSPPRAAVAAPVELRAS